MTQYTASKHLPQRVAFAIIFAFLFAVTGKLIPEIYLRFFDNTAYVTVDSPVSTDKNYFKACEDVILTSSMSTLVDVDAIILNQLILVKDDGTEIELPGSLIRIETPLHKTDLRTVSYPYKLPCDLAPGRYFWKGVITYRHHDVARTVPFISQTFNVSESGLSPAAEEVIQEGSQAPRRAPAATPTPASSGDSSQAPSHSTNTSSNTTINNYPEQQPSQNQPNFPLTLPTPPTLIEEAVDILKGLL